MPDPIQSHPVDKRVTKFKWSFCSLHCTCLSFWKSKIYNWHRRSVCLLQEMISREMLNFEVFFESEFKGLRDALDQKVEQKSKLEVKNRCYILEMEKLETKWVFHLSWTKFTIIICLPMYFPFFKFLSFLVFH